MILTAHDLGGGLFSHINMLVTVMEHIGSANLHVDWTNGLPYCVPSSGNLFEELFYQLSPVIDGDERSNRWPHYRYTYKAAEELYRGRSAWRWHLNKWWSRLHVLPLIMAEVNRMTADWKDDVAGLHIRNSSIGAECPGGISPSLADYERAIGGVTGRIYLATDNDEAVKYMRALLGERLIVRPIPRGDSMASEYHRTVAQSVSDAQNCLIDALILARCDHLIHSVSNIATAVLYMNPRMGHSFVCYDYVFRRDTQCTASERAFALDGSKRTSPERLAHFEHPSWKGWLYLYQDGIFSRHGETENGFWTEQDDIIELRWLDWNPERFKLATFSRRGEAYPHAGNGLNTLQYRYTRRVEMIVVKLTGGLGNQMFQYAFGLATSRALGVELRLSYHDKQRVFGLGVYGIQLSRYLPQKAPIVRHSGNCGEDTLRQICGQILNIQSAHVWIEGYFQNEECFSSIADEVRKLYTLQGEAPAVTEERVAVAVHVRLGDYLGSDSHYLCTSDYYSEAMTQMRTKWEKVQFLVFSDEPSKCRGYVGEHADVLIMPAMNETDTLAMMQACKGFIISNSTFSWWAAWLSGSKQIICPDRFLRRGDWNICPDHWVRLPVKGGS